MYFLVHVLLWRQDANTENISAHSPTQPYFLISVLEHNSQEKRSSRKQHPIWWFTHTKCLCIEKQPFVILHKLDYQTSYSSFFYDWSVKYILNISVDSHPCLIYLLMYLISVSPPHPPLIICNEAGNRVLLWIASGKYNSKNNALEVSYTHIRVQIEHFTLSHGWG